MVSILEHLHQYVPTMSVPETIDVPGKSEKVTVNLDYFHHVLFGGDLLTEKRALGAQRIRCNSDRGIDRLEGLLPVVEDWHGKVCLLEVIWKRLYCCASGSDAGTLFHLRNVINRRNVVKKPKNDVNACEEFFLLVVEAYILSAAMKVFSMSSLEAEPSTKLFPRSANDLTPRQRRRLLLRNAQLIVDSFVRVSYPPPQEEEEDRVLAYTKEVMSLGLLLMEFNDSVREGDGNRILQCWKFFLPIFKASKRTNYSISAFTLLSQYYFLFTPRMKKQLLWSRTVNTQGRRGKNISCDLHMEHLNRTCKNAIGVLGPNISDTSVDRIGKSVAELSKVMQQFDRENGVASDTGRHSRRSSGKDLTSVVKVLSEVRVAHNIEGRKYKKFKKIRSNMTRKVDLSDFKKWMSHQMQKLIIDRS